jgi:hypothetical protein
LESLRPRLAAGDRIFRWSGPSFVVLVERAERLERVRDQFRSVVPPKAEKNLQVANRTALVSLSATWTVFSVAAPVGDLIEQLDKFLASQWQQPAK